MGARISEKKAELVLSDYNKGIKWKECAKRAKISITSVKRILDDAKVKRQRRRGAPIGVYRVNFNINEAYLDYMNGVKLSEMTKKYHASAQLIWQRLLKLGFTLKKRRIVKSRKVA